MKQKKFFIIDWDSGLKRVKKVLEMYPITEQSDKDVFLTFGYKILNSGDKETFYLLRDLAILNENKGNAYSCQVSLDYLAEVFDTTTFCQSRRISKLKNVGLITVAQRGGGNLKSSIYIPRRKTLPDSTLVKKLIILIRRKQLVEAIQLYNGINDPITGRDVLLKISSLLKKIPKYKHLLTGNIKEALSL